MTAAGERRLIGIDWGTSACRGYLMGEDGAVLERRELVSGVGDAPAGDWERAAFFARRLDSLCGDWQPAQRALPLIACGMVGSNRGWVDAGYERVPADVREISRSLMSVSTELGLLHIVPGLLKPSVSEVTPPDVMRGEETQIVGSVATVVDRSEHVVVLPGTHTKWARLSGGVVTDFVTAMTGELFGLVMRHSIIGSGVPDAPSRDDGAFQRGLDVAFGERTGPRGIATSLFTARVLTVLGDLAPTSVRDYVSGVLIGAEVTDVGEGWLGTREQTPITVCAAPELAERYVQALARLGVRSSVVSGDVVAAGLWHIASYAGLIGEAQ